MDKGDLIMRYELTAKRLREALSDKGMTQQELADTIGKSRSSIANSVRILNLDERVIDLALEGKLSEGHCRALMSIQDNDIEKLSFQTLIQLHQIFP